MPRLLYIESSPRKDRSTSIRIAREFLDAYRAAHAGDVVDVLDLWQEELPSFDGEAINAKYAILHGQSHSTAQAAAWAKVTAVSDRFTSADKYLFSIPMWNFGIPYRLKQYLDVITQPGLTFTFSPAQGYKGMVTGKPAAVVYARGGAYAGDGAAWDFQKPYFELWLRFVGFTDIRSIVVEPTLGDPAQTDQAQSAARDLARRMAAEM